MIKIITKPIIPNYIGCLNNRFDSTYHERHFIHTREGNTKYAGL